MNHNQRLSDYLTGWDLSKPKLLRQTMTSHIYTVTYDRETVILKLFSPSETKEQIGAKALRYFDGCGAVRLLYADQGAQLLEYASGDELVTLVERGEDEAATRIIAQVLEQLHSFRQTVPDNGLFRLDDWFGELLRKAKSDRQAGLESIFIRSASVAERLLSDPQDVRVLHGDIHHRNIRQSPRGWLAFDPKGLVGERTYDCANTLCNPVITELTHNDTRLLTNAAILADKLKLDLSRVLAFTYAYACLNASWWLLQKDSSEANSIVDWHLKVANIIEPHLNFQ